MSLAATMTLTTPSEREVRFTRTFKAPRALVFEAFTRPDLLARWMIGPDGWSMSVCEVDLRPGGRFAFFLNHPLLQTPNSGWIDDHMVDPPEQYWRIGPYLIEDNSIEEVEKDVFIPFIHRPMSRYVNAMSESGLVLRRMMEPAPPPGSIRSELVCWASTA